MTTDILREFKHNIITFLDELIETFPQEVDFVVARIYLKDRVHPEDIMHTFIQNMIPLKDIISIRDEKFFLEGHVNFFDKASKGTVNHFKNIWKSGQLDDDDKNVIWKWFDTFIFLAEKYQQMK